LGADKQESLIIFAANSIVKMKIALNWLKEHIEINDSIDNISSKLTFAGLEIEHLEEKSAVKGGLSGLVVGEVISCEKIPETDKLNLTEVNIGADQPLSIVCGAPNVASGQKVIVATVGTTIYPTESDPFTIRKTKIRGVASEGMLCAEDEIGLGASHDGIIVLPQEAKVSTAAKDYYGIETETILDIGLTANRGDAASHRGVARDLAALYNTTLKPFANTLETSAEPCPIAVQLASTDCPRYSGIYIQGVSVKESPKWLKNALLSIDIAPINNIVDVTNYVLHSIGQPIHAFDAQIIKGNQIIVRKAKEGEKITTLDEKERELTANHLVIAHEDEPMAIAGVFGGLHSGIHAQTTDIFIESAYFDPVSVRKTAKHFGLNTDASFRYERGTDPNITVEAIALVTQLILETAGGSVKGTLVDLYPEPIANFNVNLRFKRVKQILGIDIDPGKMREIVQNLGMHVVSENAEGFELSVPPFKGDVTREIDVIEELIRIYGFDQIPLKNSSKLYLSDFKPSKLQDLKNKATPIMQGAGFSEIMNNSMIASQDENDQLIKLTNPLSKDTNTMRPDMVKGMLDSMNHNIKRKNENLKFFEFGKTFKRVKGGKMIEKNNLAIACTGGIFNESWQFKSTPSNLAFLQNTAQELLLNLGANYKKLHALFVIKPTEIDATLLKKYKLEGPIFYCEINLDPLLSKKVKLESVTETPKYPSVRRDLSLVIDKKVPFKEIETLTKKLAGDKLIDINVFDVYEGKPLQENEKSYSISFVWQDMSKTLEDSEIDGIADALIANFESKLNATIRR